MRLRSKTRAILVGVVCDIVIGVRIRPDHTEVVAVVIRSILVAERLDNVRQSIVLPADQDVSWSAIALDYTCDTVLIVTLARRVNRQAERVRQRDHGVVWALLGTICL